jgi:hypothetical protein
MKLFELTFLAMLSAFCSRAQTTQSPISTVAWDRLTNQVHMSAYVNNDVFARGSTIQVRLRISDTSTNALVVLRREFGDINLPRLTIDLISDSGRTYNLTPVGRSVTLGVKSMGIASGTTNEWRVPVDITTNIPSGNYKLRLTQPVYFMFGDYNQLFELEAIAQTNQPASSTPAWDSLTNWDHLRNQVHMSALVSSNVVAAGSTVEVVVRISNASPNELGLFCRDVGVDLPSLRVDLIGESGQIYNLASGDPTKPLDVDSLSVFGKTTNEWKVPVDIKTNIASGSYTLRMTQLVFFMGGDYKEGFEVGGDLKLEIK